MPKRAKPVRRSQAERRNASEHKLLNAVASVVVEEGYSAITFDRVSAKSGFSRGLASQRFGSKEGMVLAVVEYLNNRLDARYVEGLNLAGGPLDEISSYLGIFFEEIDVDPMTLSYFVLLAAAIANKSAIQPVFVEAHDHVKRTLTDMIERGKANGTIRSDLDTETVALAIGSFQMGIAMQLRLDPSFDVKKIGRAMLPAIRAILSAES